MIIVILVIGLVILAAGITLHGFSNGYFSKGIRGWAYNNEGKCFGLIVVGAIITMFASISTISLGYDCSTEKAINVKIEMYQQENQHIETVVAETVKSYQDYESQTFANLTPQEIMVAVSMYPELKSNELVVEQLRIYTSNNDKIKALKVKQIDLITKKWWLYFGE